MNYYALLYRTVDNYVNLRAPFRAAHLALAEAAQQRGELLLGGAFREPADGALLVFRAESAAVVEQFVAADPYVQNGLVTQWEIRPWTVVIGCLFESRP